MKKLLMILPLVILLCFTFACQAFEEAPEEPAVDVEADVVAIKSLVDEWVVLYNDDKYEKLVSVYYAEDAVGMPPNEPLHMGRESFLNRYKKESEKTDYHVDSSIAEDIRVSGDLAFLRGLDKSTNTPKDGGEPIKEETKWVGVFERQPDGTWKCIYEIWNSNLPLPEEKE